MLQKFLKKIDFNRMSTDVKTGNGIYDNNFADKFLALFKDKEPEWVVIASTLIDSTNYFEVEQEILNKVYAIKSDFNRSYIDEVWNDLKNKNLVQ